MIVQDLMTPHVISVKPADTLATARRVLRENRIHHLIVLEGTRIEGLLTYRDLTGKPDDALVSSVMVRDVQTVEPWMPVREVATLMVGRPSGCLPVMNGGELAGIITTTDLLRAATSL